MILFFAQKRYATCSSDDKLTTGSVGMLVQFGFSVEWYGITSKVAVFRAGSVSVDVLLTDDSCTVPPEVLATPGDTLTIGVYGTDGTGAVVIPTVYAEAGRILRGAEPSGIEPTPQTQPLIDQLLAAAEEAERVAQSVRDDADNGSFDGSDGVSPTISSESITGGHRLTIVDASGTTSVDVMNGENGDPGADGNCIWWTTYKITSNGVPGYGEIYSNRLKGRSGTPAVQDLVVGPAIGQPGSIEYLYEISSVAGQNCVLKSIGSIKGDPGVDGYSPTASVSKSGSTATITITDQNGTTTATVTDGTDGQDGQSGVAIGPTEPTDPDVNVWVDTSGGSDDSGAVTSVNGATGDVVLSASDVGAVASNQGSANAGKFLIIGSDGTVTPITMSAWQGGNY